MLDRLIDLIVGRFLTHTAITLHDHRVALKGHALLQQVFFPDITEEVVCDSNVAFVCTDTYDVTV